MDPSTPPGPPIDLSVSGPLTREQARAILHRADSLLASGDFGDAAMHYQRVVGHPAPDVTAAAFLGLGEALYRLDEDDAALRAWRSVLELPETPATYPAMRNVAAALVRAGDLRGALDVYRQAERRAPPEDRAELASRLGWLTKELGDQRASRRYFSRARGDITTPLTFLIIGLTTGVTVAAWLSVGSGLDLYGILQLDKAAVANGEYWRLFTVTLVHAPLAQYGVMALLHLGFNMYALWLVGPIVERFYGSIVFGLMYLLCAAAGSIGSFLWSDAPSVGASGAIFGMFGVLIAVQRVHDPMVDRGTRAMLGQLLPIVLINLVFGLFAGYIDIAAHVGGLLAGLWLGFILVPTRVPTLASRWQRPAGQPGPATIPGTVRWLGVVALVGVLIAALAVGTQDWNSSHPPGSAAVATTAVATAATTAGRAPEPS